MSDIDDVMAKSVRKMIEGKEKQLAELKEFWYRPERQKGEVERNKDMSGLRTLNKYSINVRTLKDIGFNPHGLHMAFPDYVEELRKVAKEWVTELWGEVGLVATKAKRENVIPVQEMMKLNAQIDWINMFFNLEDEDK